MEVEFLRHAEVKDDVPQRIIRTSAEALRFDFQDAWLLYSLAKPNSDERAKLWEKYVVAREAYLGRSFDPSF